LAECGHLALQPDKRGPRECLRRARFPVIFELYSTRFGTATPNPNLGPERATSFELGWKSNTGRNLHLEGAVFYSNVRDLIQTVVLPDTTTQTQNVGDGSFYGAEIGADARVAAQLRVGANYTAISRTITDALLPNLRPTGVPTHKAFLYAAWQPIQRLTITPSVDVAGDRWSGEKTLRALRPLRFTWFQVLLIQPGHPTRN
jgi:iron complex outermembrane receptor protein